MFCVLECGVSGERRFQFNDTKIVGGEVSTCHVALFQ